MAYDPLHVPNPSEGQKNVRAGNFLPTRELSHHLHGNLMSETRERAKWLNKHKEARAKERVKQLKKRDDDPTIAIPPLVETPQEEDAEWAKAWEEIKRKAKEREDEDEEAEREKEGMDDGKDVLGDPKLVEEFEYIERERQRRLVRADTVVRVANKVREMRGPLSNANTAGGFEGLAGAYREREVPQSILTSVDAERPARLNLETSLCGGLSLNEVCLVVQSLSLSPPREVELAAQRIVQLAKAEANAARQVSASPSGATSEDTATLCVWRHPRLLSSLVRVCAGLRADYSRLEIWKSLSELITVSCQGYSKAAIERKQRCVEVGGLSVIVAGLNASISSLPVEDENTKQERLRKKRIRRKATPASKDDGASEVAAPNKAAPAPTSAPASAPAPQTRSATAPPPAAAPAPADATSKLSLRTKSLWKKAETKVAMSNYLTAARKPSPATTSAEQREAQGTARTPKKKITSYSNALDALHSAPRSPAAQAAAKAAADARIDLNRPEDLDKILKREQDAETSLDKKRRDDHMVAVRASNVYKNDINLSANTLPSVGIEPTSIAGFDVPGMSLPAVELETVPMPAVLNPSDFGSFFYGRSEGAVMDPLGGIGSAFAGMGAAMNSANDTFNKSMDGMWNSTSEAVASAASSVTSSAGELQKSAQALVISGRAKSEVSDITHLVSAALALTVVCAGFDETAHQRKSAAIDLHALEALVELTKTLGVFGMVGD